jgi:hypothetical protein
VRRAGRTQAAERAVPWPAARGSLSYGAWLPLRRLAAPSPAARGRQRMDLRSVVWCVTAGEVGVREVGGNGTGWGISPTRIAYLIGPARL